MCSAETRAHCLLDGVVGVGATLVTVFLSIVLLRWRKVTREHRRCFQRLEQAGYHSDRLLRSLDKAIALSVPPVSGTNRHRSKPLKKGLVLIGGFGDMPFMWEGLSERASKAGWYTLAPRTPGWGRIDFEEVNHVSWRDWVLACRDAVAVVRGLCAEVTIVAHSTGAPVAALVAEILPVDRLIFTGPNFVSQASDRWAQKLLLLPILGPLVTLFLHTVVKKQRRGRPLDNLNVAAYPTAFYLTCFPIRPLRQMWMLQSQLSRPWKVSEEVIMLMGESDGSVAPLPEQVEKIRPFLPKGVPFRACSIPDAGHGLPTETERVVDTLASVVLGDILDGLTKLGKITEEVIRTYLVWIFPARNNCAAHVGCKKTVNRNPGASTARRITTAELGLKHDAKQRRIEESEPIAHGTVGLTGRGYYVVCFATLVMFISFLRVRE